MKFTLKNEKEDMVIIYDMLGNYYKTIVHNRIYKKGINDVIMISSNNVDSILFSSPYEEISCLKCKSNKDISISIHPNGENEITILISCADCGYIHYLRYTDVKE